MELGLLCEFDAPRPWEQPHPWGQRLAEQASYKNNIDQVLLADELGFQTVWLVEHHFREGRSHLPSSEVVLGALSQVTKQIRLGFGVTLMPHNFSHPVRVAEKVATVDVLSGGRVEWGMGRSGPMEQAAFGVDPVRSKDEMLAAAKSVVKMWENEYFEEYSEYMEFPKRMITPKPFQYPHPPVWMAASSLDSVRAAGQNSLGLLCFSIQHPLEKLAELIRVYREEQTQSKPLTSVRTNKVGVYVLVHCTEDFSDSAVNQVIDAIDWRFSGVADFALKWDYPNMSAEMQMLALPRLTELAEGKYNIQDLDREGMIVVGTPEECVNRFMRLEEIGVDEVLCYVSPGNLTQEMVLKSIRLLGEYVLPEVRRRSKSRSQGAC